MDSTKLIFGTTITLFGWLGSYVPVWLAGSSPLSGASILGGFLGTLAGLWAGYLVRDFLG